MKVIISDDAAPAIGDVRKLGAGDVIVIRRGTIRRDWARYADAIIQAIGRGAEVRHG